MNDNKKELIKKLKAMIDDPACPDGERIAAETALSRVMEKYNISETDIESFDKKTYRIWFKSKDEDRQYIYTAVIANFIHNVAKCSDYKQTIENLKSYHYSRKQWSFFELSLLPWHYAELMARIDFYYDAYIKEKETFNYAFIMKNKIMLYIEPEEQHDKDITKEADDIEKAKRLSEMIDRHEFNKQVSGEAKLLEKID